MRLRAVTYNDINTERGLRIGSNLIPPHKWERTEAEALRRMGAPHRLLTASGCGHALVVVCTTATVIVWVCCSLIGRTSCLAHTHQYVRRIKQEVKECEAISLNDLACALGVIGSKSTALASCPLMAGIPCEVPPAELRCLDTKDIQYWWHKLSSDAEEGKQ